MNDHATIASRLQSLRDLLRKHGLTHYMVPTADPHQSEYVPAFWRRREAISGFTGSAGSAVIGLDAAWLVTDSRYHLQAEKELDPASYFLMREGAPGVPRFGEWLAGLTEGGVLGIDPRLLSSSQERTWRAAAESRGGRLAFIDENLVDAVWSDRPAAPKEPLHPLATQFTGEAPAAKLARVQAAMKEAGCSALVASALDAVAWLFDVRGADVDCNPVAIAHALVEADGATLFIDHAKLSDAVRAHLPPSVKIRDYDDFGSALDAAAARRGTIWVESTTCSAWTAARVVAGGSKVHDKRSPITDFKARKNATEVEGMRRCHVRDGVAMVRFFTWLEKTVASGHVSEIEAAGQLADFRAEGENFKGLSFESISGFAEHGAIVHYRPAEEGHRTIDGSSLYLIDSGGQYLDGTTDITRTIALGTPTDDQREMFTRVLKGHVALARVTFPKGTSGTQLDVLARQPLWEAGRNYGHGTGHGVGMYLNVHEGPQRIAQPRGQEDPALEPGMVLSNEPGYYENGQYGIRIENLIVVVEKPNLGVAEPFLGFDTITCCPIDRGLIDAALLSPAEKRWVDDYHAWCRETLAPFLDADARAWLSRATDPL